MIKKNMKKAFTLVELSIVLVIIGLLTAGVVGGASLVESAKMQATVSDWTKYKTAYNAFKLEYDALPGDMANAYDYWGATCGANTAVTSSSFTGCNGNGDGKIVVHEGQKAMQHMQLAGIATSGITIGNVLATVVVGTNIPKARFDSGGYQFMFGPEWWGYGTAIGRQDYNILILGNPAVADVKHYPRGALLTPKQMKTIDTKADDGVYYKGAVSGEQGTTDATPTWGNCGNGTTGAYTLTITTATCIGVFKLE